MQLFGDVLTLIATPVLHDFRARDMPPPGVFYQERFCSVVLWDFSHKDLEIPTVDTTPLGMFGIFPGTNVVQVDNASDGAR